jgi:hypothetical protein
VTRQPLATPTRLPRGVDRLGPVFPEVAIARPSGREIGSLRRSSSDRDCKCKCPLDLGMPPSEVWLKARRRALQGTAHIPEGGIARRKSLKPALVDAGGTRNPGAPNFF